MKFTRDYSAHVTKGDRENYWSARDNTRAQVPEQKGSIWKGKHYRFMREQEDGCIVWAITPNQPVARLLEHWGKKQN